MKKMLSLLLFSLFATVGFAQQNGKTLSGKWEYNAPQAPYGYEKGNIEFITIDDKLGGTVTVQGNIIRINEIKQNGDVYTCIFYMDGSQVNTEFKWKENKLNGKAEVKGMTLDVQLNPVKED